MVMLTLAFAVLTHAFLVDDFSVAIVSSQSNSELLLVSYKFASAVWGGWHEGSLVAGGCGFCRCGYWRWRCVQSATAVGYGGGACSPVMGAVAGGFLSAVHALLTSNPFARLLPVNLPLEGADLNPLLQDPGMVIHPPMLYDGLCRFLRRLCVRGSRRCGAAVSMSPGRAGRGL